VAIFGGLLPVDDTNYIEQMSPDAAISHLGVATLRWNEYFRLMSYPLQVTSPDAQTASTLVQRCDELVSPISLAPPELVVWRSLLKNGDMEVLADCGYVANVTLPTGITTANKTDSLIAALGTPCADDKIMMNSKARQHVTAGLVFSDVPVGAFLDGDYLIGYTGFVQGTSTCNILYNTDTNERVLIEEAEYALNIDIGATTTTTFIAGRHPIGLRKSSGIFGVFIALDGVVYGGMQLLDALPLIPQIGAALFGMDYSAVSLYTGARELFLSMLWLAAILFVLTCVWAVYASHRTF
jgi:hypothetical protein